MGLQQRLRGRPAHTPGPTYLSYTPNGSKLVTVGSNNAIRIFKTGSDAEPTNIDDGQESNLAVAATNDFFLTGSEDGSVCKYSLITNSLDEVLVRCSLPVRDIALSPDSKWAAVASDEIVVKIVSTQDMTRIHKINDHQKPVKHLTFDHSGKRLAVSCTDGVVYIYNFRDGEAELSTKVDGLIKKLETTDESSARVAWHPDGQAFAAPTATHEVQVISTKDSARQRAFKDSHRSDVTALAWSPNGALLATSGIDRKLVLWNTKTQKTLNTYDNLAGTVLAMHWHPTENILSYTNSEGELYIHEDFVPPEHAQLLNKSLQSAPYIHEPLSEPNGNVQKRPLSNELKEREPIRRERAGTPDSLDMILDEADSDGGVDDGGLDDFVVDDDGNGYADPEEIAHMNAHGKRTNGHLPVNGRPVKRLSPQGIFSPVPHAPFQPGSTPWQGSQRYLVLNFTGCVYSTDQGETHNTISIDFWDTGSHRVPPIKDYRKYDKACLTEHGALFSCQATREQPATLWYRPHETWTQRSDWHTPLPKGENPVAIALSDSYVVVTTSKGYVRIYTLFGTPFRVYRHKASPAVTCVAWRDYVLTVGNGPVGADGRPQLLYSIENVKRDEVCQAEDVIPLPPSSSSSSSTGSTLSPPSLSNIFFSTSGDPCIYDSTGVLLTLLHWRTPSQARWTPLLDTALIERQLSGKHEESYYPVAVAEGRFYYVLLKGRAMKYPDFRAKPRLDDMEFEIPICSKGPQTKIGGEEEDDDVTELGFTQKQQLEEAFVRTSILASLQSDLLFSTTSTSTQRHALSALELDIDKTLVKMLDAECLHGEERGMKALELVGLIKNEKMLEAAAKVAGYRKMDVLADKIRELAERRLVGLEDDEL